MKPLLYLILTLLPLLSLRAQTTFLEVLDEYDFNPSAFTRVLSDSSSLKLSRPTLAYVNLTSKYGIPYTKTSNFKDWIEYFDPETNTYFKKRARVNVQGATSTTFPKRNITMQFCDDEWVCDSVPTIDFKGWVRQDAFHLKAFYTDWLKGVGIVGYQLFDEMESVLPEGAQRIWQRAGVDAKDNARCYPDGFPCAFYLNGYFYGVYVWQLKKHRRNMGMEKHNPTHIHLDGNLSEANLWNGKVEWSKFEIRNPKDLRLTDGTAYDGDAPAEPEEGPVKEAILALSHRCGELSALRQSGASAEEIRAYMATYFDVESMLNYLTFSTVLSNYDGFTKNWQWLTYDGQKWFVAPYDLDCTFGNFHAGTFLFPAEYSYVDSDHTLTLSRRGIATWFWDYYFDELSERYALMRDAGVFSASHISQLLHTWHDRIGTEVYEAEWPLWPKCMCVSQTLTNEGWAEYNAWTDFYHVPVWDSTRQYHAGDLCRLDNRLWLATADVKGTKPYTQMGYTDSLERLDQWIGRRIELEDDFFGYTPADLRTIGQTDANGAPYSQLYTPFGAPQAHLRPGLQILCRPDGSSQTILIR